MSLVSEPRSSMKFNIAPKHVKGAKKNQACHCVVACALMDHDEKLVGATVQATRVILQFVGGKTKRYATPPVLRKGLEHYDKTGKWDLPEGQYELPPVPTSQEAHLQRHRAELRRAAGDLNMTRKYLPSGRCRKRPISERAMNLVRLRQQTA